jgi:hypothetical protein
LACWVSPRDAFGTAATPSWSHSHFNASCAALALCLAPIPARDLAQARYGKSSKLWKHARRNQPSDRDLEVHNGSSRRSRPAQVRTGSPPTAEYPRPSDAAAIGQMRKERR